MEIEKTIKLKYEIDKKKKEVICYDLPTLITIIGSSSVVGNYHIYGVEKINNNFHIKVNELIKRRNKYITQMKKLKNNVEVQDEVLKHFGHNDKQWRNLWD